MNSRLLLFFAIILFSCECNDVHPSDARCSLEPDPGLCKAAFQRYYYDKTEGKCKMFTWGGCGGVVPFETLEECEQCVKSK
jgi:hypothetical protein